MDQQLTITVKTIAGASYNFSFNSSTTLKDLNDAIHQATNILQDEQKIFFNKQQFRDVNTKLADFGMISGSVAYVMKVPVIRPERPSPEGQFTINLKELTGRVHTVTVTKDTTVKDLIEHAVNVGWDPSKIRMIYKGISIHTEEHKTLGSFGAQPGDDVHLVEPLRGD